ncbi:unnamed protein product [Gadus morhua 'NCC']
MQYVTSQFISHGVNPSAHKGRRWGMVPMRPPGCSSSPSLPPCPAGWGLSLPGPPGSTGEDRGGQAVEYTRLHQVILYVSITMKGKMLLWFYEARVPGSVGIPCLVFVLRSVELTSVILSTQCGGLTVGIVSCGTLLPPGPQGEALCVAVPLAGNAFNQDESAARREAITSQVPVGLKQGQELCEGGQTN